MFTVSSPTYKFQITFENGKFNIEGKDMTEKKGNVSRQVDTAEEVVQIIKENLKTWFSLSTAMGFSQIFNENYEEEELVIYLESLKTPVGYIVYHPQLSPRYFTTSLIRVAEIKATCEAKFGYMNEWKHVGLLDGGAINFP